MPIDIRVARADDLPRIVEIYNQAVLQGGVTADLQPLDFRNRRAWFEEHTPGRYPIFLADVDGVVAGWCSLSPYRPGRGALRFTAEISYYVDAAHRRKGIGTALTRHALEACPALELKNLIAFILERNTPSIDLLRKAGFSEWGRFPRVADFNGEECGHVLLGLRVWDF
jgi:L-amino acid N-acyltransferase YncA